jgi:hypothetical protein
VQDVPAADGHTVDRGDHRLGDVANQLVQVADLEHAGLGGAVVAGFGPLLDIPTGAERLLAGAGEDDGLHGPVGPGQPECLDQFLDGDPAERVVAVRAVDGDDRGRSLDLIPDVLQGRCGSGRGAGVGDRLAHVRLLVEWHRAW